MVMVVALAMPRRHKTVPESATLGILAFDAGKTMCRLISLYHSLSDEEITKLHHDVIKSKGVTYLNSNQENFLINLAAAERLEELDNIAATVSRLGQKCSDLGLARFDLVYADLKHGVIDLGKLQYNSRNTHKIVDKSEKLISATASLHSAMEYLAEFEAAEKKRQQQQRYWDISKPSLKQNLEHFNEKLVHQRKQVQHLKETSLWKRTFDKIIGIMARLVCIVYARICSVFGAYVNTEKNDKNSFIRFGFGFDDCCLLEHRELYHNTARRVSEWYEESHPKRGMRCGPISKEATTTKTGGIRFLNKPMPMDFAPGGGEIEKMMNGNNDRVLKMAPPSTVGGVGLSLRYANVILSAESCLHGPTTVGDDAREALYEMLPGRLRVKVRAKLKGRLAKGSEGSDGHKLAEGWREAVEELMEWLSPMAHDTLRWQKERHLENTKFETKPTAMLLQTLHYSDLEKAETAIVEVLVGLSCIYWCEKRV
ncbi:hypothetical protein L195_g030557 [Trifolium pratense]|uniref:Avr9/Cf-9 rapidly elicited protein n=1 Tax=Trifolium pratense TaxID=57577 RepID=A0A2K3L7W4_TRIPR|nr:hypothetical protein L195_g030557 [Trifolium pratense]